MNRNYNILVQKPVRNPMVRHFKQLSLFFHESMKIPTCNDKLNFSAPSKLQHGPTTFFVKFDIICVCRRGGGAAASPLRSATEQPPAIL